MVWQGYADRLQIVASGNLPYNLAAHGKRQVRRCLSKLDGLTATMKGMRYIPLLPKLESHTVLAWKKNQMMSPALRAFVDFSKAYINRISSDEK